MESIKFKLKIHMLETLAQIRPGMTVKVHQKIKEKTPKGEIKERVQIFEGRLSWYFIPNSFKIFLTVDVKTAAERTLKNRAERQDEKQVTSVFEAEQAVLQRLASDKKRYLQYYGIDYTKLENYDITIDTTNLKID